LLNVWGAEAVRVYRSAIDKANIGRTKVHCSVMSTSSQSV
jgi:hypothetical protein